jgi:hypothetical protein
MNVNADGSCGRGSHVVQPDHVALAPSGHPRLIRDCGVLDHDAIERVAASTLHGGMALTVNVDLDEILHPLSECEADGRGTWGFGKVYALVRTPRHIGYGISLP